MTTASPAPADSGGASSPLSVLDATGAPTSHGVGRAGGKTILMGEHAVVYGRPALAVPVRSFEVVATAERTAGRGMLRSALYTGPLENAPARLLPTVTAVTATLEALGSPGAVDVRVRSDIPAERGVGSSAAVAAAVVAAVASAHGRALHPDERFALVQAAERAAHGSPSGLDARTVVADGPVWFDGGAATDVAVARGFWLVVADTGVKGRTREAVAGVRARRADDPAGTDALIETLGDLAIVARDALGAGDLHTVGEAMREAHAGLGALGVGDPALDHLVTAARAAGALGAKLTGGGRGGCVVTLASDAAQAERIAGALRVAGAAAAWTTEVEENQ